jgi:hypothetical protein
MIIFSFEIAKQKHCVQFSNILSNLRLLLRDYLLTPASVGQDYLDNAYPDVRIVANVNYTLHCHHFQSSNLIM